MSIIQWPFQESQLEVATIFLAEYSWNSLGELPSGKLT